MSKETPKLIHHALNTASKLIDSDTGISTIDLNLLENLNTNQSLNYLKLEKNLDEAESNIKLLKSLGMYRFLCLLLMVNELLTIV